MGRFRFRLQSVLDHTGRLKRKAAADFAAASQELETRQKELAAHRLVFATLGQVAPVPARMLKVARLHELQACRDRVTRQIYGAERRVQAQAEETSKTRRQLIESLRGEKKYILLKDRHLQKWRTATRRKEQREIDEIAGRRASFQKSTQKA